MSSALNELDAADAMTELALACDGELRVGVGAAGREALPLADRVAEQLRDSGRVDLVRYRIGAGVAQRLPGGTVGCYVFPVAHGDGWGNGA